MLSDELAKASLIIVDFDGTLVYLETDWQTLRKELTSYCSGTLGIEESFKNLDAGLLKIKSCLGEQAYKYLLEKVSQYEVQGYRGKKVDEVVCALFELQRKRQIAIFSKNCRQTIEKIIQELGLNVSYIIAKEDVAEHKPSGSGIEKILDFFHMKPEDAIFLGDSDLDLSAGKNAGVKTLLWMDPHV